MRKGYFIVIEGPDGSGSSTHAKALGERFERLKMPFLVTEEPSAGPVGGMARSLLKAESLPSPDTLQLLFCADRAEHLQRIIEPAVAQGVTVICDRYALSTVVYGKAQGLDRAWLEAINAPFRAPDLQIITLPPLDVSLQRIGRRHKQDAFERAAFQKIVHTLYRECAPDDAIFVDTSGDKASVAEEIYNNTEKKLSLRAIV